MMKQFVKKKKIMTKHQYLKNENNQIYFTRTGRPLNVP